MNRTLLISIALSVLAGVLYFVGFVGFDVYPLTWICFVPVLLAIRGEAVTGRRALFLGAIFGLVTNMGGYYWVVQLLTDFADLNIALALLGFVLLCLYQGFLLALVIYSVHRASRRLGVAPIWGLTVAFPALELIYPLLFPSYIGNSQYRFTAIVQLVEVTGMLGLTALIALVNGAVYEVIEARLDRRKLAPRRLAVAAGLFAGALVFGAIRLPAIDAKTAAAPKVKVAIVQTNLGSRDKAEKRSEFIRRHQAMSREAIAAHPEIELLVWPESAYNSVIDRREQNLRARMQAGIERPVIFGALTMSELPSGEREFFNTAVLTSSTGDVRGMFDKVELLAFGETIPFVATFPSIKKLFPRSSTFTHGRTFENFALPGGSTLLPMICYEDIIPAFVRRMWRAAGPASALVNVTNDSWYGNTHEPLIHLVLASFRSIETRRALIRSTNTGISAFVDPAGRLVKRTGQWTQETLIDDVPMIADGSTTIYMHIGDVVGWVAVGFLAYGFVRSREKKKQKKRT